MTPTNSVPTVGGVPIKAVDITQVAKSKAKLQAEQKAQALDVQHSALIVDANGAVEFLLEHPGWCIFPGRIVREGARWMKLPAKGLPWTSAATNDPSEVMNLWALHGTPVPELGGPRMACVAVHVGKSGLVVLDQDQDLSTIEGENADLWRAAIAESETLTLRSCTRGMPHYVYRQRDGQLVDIQNWAAGEVKSQNGYIFVSTHEPLVVGEAKVIPEQITRLLTTTSASDVASSYDNEHLVKMNDRDLEVWLATTDCRLEPSQEEGLINNLIEHLNTEADGGHRRDAMRKACMTLVIEASAGLYGAQAAWDRLEEAYQDLRNDPGRNSGVKTKEWSSHWWRDTRVLLAGAVEKVQAGRYDDAIDEKRERFGIMSDSEEDALRTWFEQFEGTQPVSSAPALEAPARTRSSSPEPMNVHEALATSAAASEASRDDLASLADDTSNPNLPPETKLDIDPNEKLRKLADERGVNLDHVLGALTATTARKRAAANLDPVREAVRISKKVDEKLERDLIQQIAKSVVATPVEAESWDWLKDGGIEALIEKAPGSMLMRADGEGLIYDRGCVHLIGDKSTGKSWLCAKLAVERMSEGEHVSWLDYETDQQQLAERLLQAGASIEMVTEQMHYFSMKGEAIGGAVEAIGQLDPLPTCMIVDSVDASMAHSGADNENDSSGYHAWRAAIAPLTEVMVTVLIEHTGHENAHRARGASAKGQQADQEFSAKVIKPFSKDDAGLVEWTCRKNRRGGSFTTDDVAAYLSIEPAGPVKIGGAATKLSNSVRMTLLGPGAREAIETSSIAGAAAIIGRKDEAILAWVKTQKHAWTVKNAVTALSSSGCTKADVDAVLKPLRETGRLHSMGDGRLMWT